MLSKEANERLTRVGPGTAVGALLRRYWHPVAASVQLLMEPVQEVRILGEDLVLYRSEDGYLGLTQAHCPHRHTSLAYGIPEPGGLRCAYHGWKFDCSGQCVNQPAEPADSTFKQRVRITAYPVQELGGLVWAYLGPAPAPLLPRFDLLVRDGLEREIGFAEIPCNWLQIMENSMDPVHAEHLHGNHANYMLHRQAKTAMRVRHHARMAFDVFEFGIVKRRLLEGQTEDVDDWRIGHPVLFPAALAVGTDAQAQFQFRVPIDDQRTMHWWYLTRPSVPGAPQQTEIPLDEFLYQHENGRFMVETAMGQDIMAWITAGSVMDRSTEKLATSDAGVILYRQLLDEQLATVERGEDPLGVLREAARNEPWIQIPRERVFEYQGRDSCRSAIRTSPSRSGGASTRRSKPLPWPG
ncbi:MAG TPA: aromatic ring-hydroxylating dioxygenase subunit alpha [Chloroflexota bacterium]